MIVSSGCQAALKRELLFLELEAGVFVCYAHGNQHQLLLETLSLLAFFFFF